MKNPDVVYGLQTKKFSLESACGPERLITRLADQRADRVRAADAQGKYHRLEGEVHFGPVKRAVAYVAADASVSHTLIN